MLTHYQIFRNRIWPSQQVLKLPGKEGIHHFFHTFLRVLGAASETTIRNWIVGQLNCFHMKSRPPCWCAKPFLWELNYFSFSCPPEDTWYGVILWVLRLLGQSLNQSARIFCTRAFWLLRHTDEPQRERNSCLWLQSRSVLSSFGVVLMSCRVNFHVVRSALQYSACRI